MTDYDRSFRTIDTNVVHAGAPQPNIGGAVVTPLFQSANYVMSGETTYDALTYIRLSNSPSHLTLQARLATIESGEAALVTASGMAAITTSILAFAGAGDHALTQRTLYGGSQSFYDHDAPRMGINYTAVDASDPTTWESALTDRTKIFYVESISNPLLEVGDLAAVVAFAGAHGLTTIIDNTFASPVNFRPLEIGFDLVVHSATKYLNGHSDIVAGCVIGSSTKVDAVRRVLVHLGGSADPHACFLMERGLKTLVLRMERHNANAQRLATFLASQRDVRRVNYPGLPGDPSHSRALALFSGCGGMLSFTVDGPERAERVIERLRIPVHAASLGGPETLVVRPAASSHLGQTDDERARAGITDDLIRVSVGIEDADELLEDFAQALDA